MQSIKLIKLLKSLSKEEFHRFKKFIQSPFYSNNKNLIPFYNFLAKYHPEFDAARFTKEHAFRRVFGTGKFIPAKINKLAFEMTNLVQEFLWVTEIQKNDFRKRKVLNEVYGKRNLYDFFKKETEHLLADLEAQPYRDMNYFRDRIDLNYGKYFHALNNKYNLNDTSLQQVANDVDRYFAIAKFRFGTELKNQERILAKQIDLNFLEAVKTESNSILLKGNIVFELYKTLFELFETGEEKHFFELKRLFFSNVEYLRRLDQLSIFLNGLNYPIQKINHGKEAFILETFEWYKLGIQYEFLIQGGELAEGTFGNIVSLGCQLGELDWTKEFIENYAVYLNKKIQGDAKAHNLGLVLFYEKDYENALFLLSTHSFSPFHQIKARFLIIQILFEIFLLNDAYFEILIAQIEAFQKLLRRDKILSKMHKQAHLNGTLILKRYALAIVQKHNLKKEQTKLLEELDTGKLISLKSWLRRKLKGK